MQLNPEQTFLGQGLHVWRGVSDRRYRYVLHMFGTAFGPGAPNFIYARETRPGMHFPIYVGQAADLTDPVPDLEIMALIRSHRPTHIHVRYNEDGLELRLAEQADLVAQLSPPCNSK